jgi:nicotinate phosphoribosyltransferase
MTEIIKSLLDNDLYKFTMQQAVLCKFSDTPVEYEFKCRNKEPIDLICYKQKIRDYIDGLGDLKFQQDELDYLRTLRYMKPSYVNFLRNFRLNPENVTLYEKDGKLGINIKGNWLDTILFEVPVLAIVSEIYCNNEVNATMILLDTANTFFDMKVKLLNEYNERTAYDLKFTDFGTRRRLGYQCQKHIISRCLKELPKNFVGTSNVHFAKEFKTTPIGTMAHEWIMAGQGMEEHTSVKYSQRYMLQKWAEVYRGDLGTALSDTLGFDAFLNDFDMYFAKLFDGCRHDSGNPYVWGEKLIEHYNKYRIDPTTKTAVFSDGLDFQKMIDIYHYFDGKMKMSFGIGTNLTNDCGVKPLQIVIKMTKCNGRPVAKISDSVGKQMCEDKEYLRYLASRFNIPKVRVEC